MILYSRSAKPLSSSLGSRPTSAATKPPAKPKLPIPSAPKSADKKPLANGEIKTTAKSSLIARKETTATKTTTSTTKTSPTKPPTPKVSIFCMNKNMHLFISLFWY